MRTIPEGYRIHMIAALDNKARKVAGAIYSNFIPRIGSENLGFSLITYIAVRPEYRRQGIAMRLADEAIKAAHADSMRAIGKRAVGLLFEIENEGKAPVERLVQKLGGHPLDIDYYQPPVREGCSEQPMNLWLMPFDQPVHSWEEARKKKYPVEFIHDMVKSLFLYEYPGPDRSGFKEDSKPYQRLLCSVKNRRFIGFKMA